MNANQKKLLAGFGLLGVGIAWVPQLLSASRDIQPPARPEIPANARPADVAAIAGRTTRSAQGEATITSGASSASSEADTERPTSENRPLESPSLTGTGVEAGPALATASGAEAQRGASSGAESRAPGELSTSLEKTLGAIRAVLPDKAGADLDVLAKAWSYEAEPKTAPVGSPVTSAQDDARLESDVPAASSAPAASSTPATSAPSGPPPDPVAVFIAAHPLNGVLITPHRKLAQLGDRLVAEGDDLIPGLRVESIEPRCVVLARVEVGLARVEVGLARVEAGPAHVEPGLALHRTSLRIELEPLKVRAHALPGGSGSTSAGQASSAPDGKSAASLGSASPSTDNLGAGATIDAKALSALIEQALAGKALSEASKSNADASQDPKKKTSQDPAHP